MGIGVGLFIAAFALGAFGWFFFEYMLHRFAFHEMKGMWFGSREHLEHHVQASWNLDPLMVFVWLLVALVGFGWGQAMLALSGSVAAAWGVGAGFSVGYYFYEHEHRLAHVKAPSNRWHRWIRKHHFHHHFGQPNSNHNVTIPLWDFVFRTTEKPDRVRVPRRLVMPWLIDEDGNVRPEFADDYELVGSAEAATERQIKLDRARAFANQEPIA